MKRLWRRGLALLMMLVVLMAGVPAINAAAFNEVAVAGVGATNNAATPPISQAASILGISQTQVESLRAGILDTILNFRTEISVEKYGIRYSQAVNDCISGLISNTMPETFQINDWMFYHSRTNGVITRIEFTEYKYTKQTYQEMISQCDEVAEYLTHDLVNSGLTEVRKALLLHDRLAVWVEYDKAALDSDTVPYIEHTMYGSLWNRLAVCDGYAEAYTYLLRLVGIESYVCRSDALDHAWNIVKVEGKWYHVDVTWDDPTWDVTGRVNHDNFLRSSAGIFATDHDAYDYDTTPTDTKFDSTTWPWFSSTTSFQYLNGRLYYIDNQQEMLCYWEGNTLYNAYSVEDTWWISDTRYYVDNYSRLSADEDYLYFSLAQSVHRYDPKTGQVTALHYPTFTNRKYHNIYGMKIAFNILYCDITDNPKFDANTKKNRQELARYRDTEAEYVLIDQLPTKLRYSTGESLNTSGLRIKVRFSDGTSQYLTSGFTVTGLNTAVSGSQTLTVTYGGETATFNVVVLAASAGDVDGNGKIDSTDARLVLQYAVGKIKSSQLKTASADVDGNGKVDSTDARLILQYAVGKIKSF